MTNAEIARKIIGIVMSDGLFIDMERRVVEFLDAKDAERDRLRSLLVECLGDMDEGDDLTTLTPRQACHNMGYCPELGYPVETDGCLPCRIRTALKGTASAPLPHPATPGDESGQTPPAP